MRARKKKNLVPRLERCAEYLTDRVEPDAEKPVWLEIGCGKGRFAVGMAQLFDCKYYAMEKVPDVMVMAAEKGVQAALPNLKFIIGDANDLETICPEHCVDILYLTFCDPWPKKRDTKRRLTYRAFLEKYKRVLKDNGIIFFKTDNQKLFEFSVEEMKQNGFELFDYTEDLHSSDIPNPVCTEYETRFSDLGQPIYHVKARVIKSSETDKSDVSEINQ
ncbi:MAG: tRNA (guanosine(46)-N7)-methyltransferase TrmB [Eubacteriales bacterium]